MDEGKSDDSATVAQPKGVGKYDESHTANSAHTENATILSSGNTGGENAHIVMLRKGEIECLGEVKGGKAWW